MPAPTPIDQSTIDPSTGSRWNPQSQEAQKNVSITTNIFAGSKRVRCRLVGNRRPAVLLTADQRANIIAAMH